MLSEVKGAKDMLRIRVLWCFSSFSASLFDVMTFVLKLSDIQGVGVIANILHTPTWAAMAYVRCSVAGTDTTPAHDVSVRHPKRNQITAAQFHHFCARWYESPSDTIFVMGNVGFFKCITTNGKCNSFPENSIISSSRSSCWLTAFTLSEK